MSVPFIVSPWYPSTNASAVWLARYGSSPKASSVRPHRGSRSMFTVGAQ